MLNKALTIGAFLAIIAMLTYLVWKQNQKTGVSATTEAENDDTPASALNSLY